MEATQHFQHGEPRRGTAQIFLNGTHVGDSVIQGWDGSWGFGSFTPNDNFPRFAPLFGLWLLLMHVDDDRAALSPEAAGELCLAEQMLDHLHGQLYFPEKELWIPVAQLTIDCGRMEWKEY